MARRVRRVRSSLHIFRRSELLKEGNLRAKYDVIVYPARRRHRNLDRQRIAHHRENSAALQKDGWNFRISVIWIRATTFAAAWASKVLRNLRNLFRKAARSSLDGSTATIFPDFGITSGVTVEHPDATFRSRLDSCAARFADKKSPIAYGFDGSDLPVYFNQDPVLNASGGGFGGFGGGRGAGGAVSWRRGGGDINGGLKAKT